MSVRIRHILASFRCLAITNLYYNFPSKTEHIYRAHWLCVSFFLDWYVIFFPFFVINAGAILSYARYLYSFYIIVPKYTIFVYTFSFWYQHIHISSTELCVMYKYKCGVCVCLWAHRVHDFPHLFAKALQNCQKICWINFRIESGISPITMPLRCGVTFMSFTTHAHIPVACIPFSILLYIQYKE